jgi:hypothetical protein
LVATVALIAKRDRAAHTSVGTLRAAYFMMHKPCRFNVVGSKFLSPTGNQLLDFLSTDWYYSMLLPMSVVATLVAAYLNWLAMKFFRHN